MDNLIVPARLRIQKNQVILIHRELPGTNTKVHVKVGDEVSPQQLIGEGQTPAGFRVIHLAAELGETPKKAFSFLKVPIGKTVYTGELLAEKTGGIFGLGKKIITVPADGVIDIWEEKTGDLRIKLLPKLVKEVSGVYGVVEQINLAAHLVSIRTMAIVIYGLLGSGKERSGILKVYGAAHDLISSKQITSTLRGKILVGGSLVFSEALEKALSYGILGIISGGMNTRDYKSVVGGRWNLTGEHWSDVGVSLMLTEGFGSVTLGQDIFTILQEYDGHFVLIDGNKSTLILPSRNQNSIIDIRKAKVTQIVSRDNRLRDTTLHIGDKVRIIAPPYLGVQGTVESIDQTVTKLPSGISVVMVTVAALLKKIRVPYLNLEVI